MLTVLSAIAPIFAAIGLGYAGRRWGPFGPASHAELTRFVTKLALPVLLFRIMAEAHPAEIWQPGFIVASGAGSLVIFAAAILIRRRTVPTADAIVDGLAAGYSNTAFIGIPLCLSLLGATGVLAASIASILTVCLLFAFSILLIEAALQPEASLPTLVGRALLAAARNPLVYAPAAGALFSIGGVELPVPVARFAELLGAAASPCALVALGLFVGEPRPKVPGQAVGLLAGFKLLVQPAITWLIAYVLWPLPPVWAKAAVLLAALPTGTGPFMLAELYGREANLTARTILITTTLSIVTITVLMAIL
ncbi:AEC family transporter [Sphingomonas crocodyli]|uniref:AEC family transporter n=1 Tax=Sphingomonas crocodyli TaxID=1979270 RepID=A0A437LVP5_9SPHN|nr:AEC family transporter [Sphingomonas crocodyli]RVT89451.1 AEC family transporter [Sphingomonas crocodyli]